jgi:S1-C subfamily serine protease
VVITSEQAMGSREQYEVVRDGAAVKARILARDPGTNLLILKPEQSLATQGHTTGLPQAGAFALALGADVDGVATVRAGVVHAVAAQWYSRAGGRIDARIALDIRLTRTEEGGPVLDAQGAMLGMSTHGTAGQVLVIPTATIERVVPELVRDGRVARGWLGLALQPVAVPHALRDAAGHTSGMMVMSIANDSPGAKGGIAPGDILLTVGETPVRMRSLAALLDASSVGKQVQLRVIRGGEIVSLETVISARPI